MSVEGDHDDHVKAWRDECIYQFHTQPCPIQRRLQKRIQMRIQRRLDQYVADALELQHNNPAYYAQLVAEEERRRKLREWKELRRRRDAILIALSDYSLLRRVELYRRMHGSEYEIVKRWDADKAWVEATKDEPWATGDEYAS